jgi:hypothetical protein
VRSFRVVLSVGLGGLVAGAAVPVPAKGRGQGVVERVAWSPKLARNLVSSTTQRSVNW